MKLEDNLRRFLGKYACEQYTSTDTVEDIIRKWHEPSGIEFSKKFNFPSIDFVRKYKAELEPFGVYVDRNDIDISNQNVVLFNCTANLHYQRPIQRYSVVLFADNIVTISAQEYAFVVCSKLSPKNTIVLDKDDYSIVTIKS